MNKLDPIKGIGSCKHDIKRDIPQNDTSQSPPQTPQLLASTNTYTVKITPTIKKQYQPAPYLSSQEWHKLLLAHTLASRLQSNDDTTNHNTRNIHTINAILIDARNIYNSNIGHFQIPMCSPY